MTATGAIKLPMRLPRYCRIEEQAHLALTPRDLAILRTVQAYRLASSDQIQALTDGSNQGILRRLQKLFHAGLLDRVIRRSSDSHENTRMVYAMTNRGVKVLQKEGLMGELTKTDLNAQNRDLHGYSVEHALLVSQFRAVLDRACALGGLKVLGWREGPRTWDAVEVPMERGYARVPVAPDAFFGLEDPKGRLYFFLEADRGTMTVRRFMRKLEGYAAYWRDKRHQQKFGIRYFRVLTVATGSNHMENLVAAARKTESLAGLGRLFLFTEAASLRLDDPAGLFSPIWTTLADQGLHSILGEGPSAQPKGDENAWKTQS
jgi:hypothetical protein